jgi:SAM-dependent methyltransferase
MAAKPPKLKAMVLGVVGRLRELGESLAGAFARAFSRSPDKKLFFVLNSSEINSLASALHSQMPQASLGDGEVTSADRDWREHFVSRLQGTGIEIGALHKPVPRHDRMKVLYVDYMSGAESRARYPELADETILEPDILDDGQTLATIDPESYEFVIAAHVIEHIPNPILAIKNWLRVLKDGGLLYLVVPDKRFSFDRHRVRTTLEHLVLDFQRPSAERDYEHFLDYAMFVHHVRGNDALREADRMKDTGHSIHYHVFTPGDVVSLIRWVALNVEPVAILEGPCLNPYHEEFHLLVRKGPH